MPDSTSLWVFLQKNKKHVGSAALALLIFAAGWQAGRITSPYTNAEPIVFEDRQCSECSSSGGDAQALENLKDEGIAAREDTTKPAVAGASTTPSTSSNSANSLQKGNFVGSVNSDLFHDLSCSSVGRIKEENKVWFTSVEDAQAAGYKPSKCTQEKLGI